MKKIEDIKKEIAELQSYFKDEKKLLKEVYDDNKKKLLSDKKKAGKRVTWLTFCATYLQFNPKESFMKSELDRVTFKIELLKTECPYEAKAVAKTISRNG